MISKVDELAGYMSREQHAHRNAKGMKAFDNLLFNIFAEKKAIEIASFRRYSS